MFDSMKKLLIIILLATACSEDDSPVFKIEGGPYFETLFNDFVGIAEDFEVAVPRNNMILRSVEDDNAFINNSRAYRERDQLIIQIDRAFIDANAHDGGDDIKVIFQQLANGLLGTQFRDCGIMKKVENGDDLTGEDWYYDDWANLFDSSTPCN